MRRGAAGGCVHRNLLRPYVGIQNQLLGFEMAPGDSAVVRNIVKAANLGRVRSRCNVNVGGGDAVDRHADRIPRVDIAAQIARLPAQRPNTVKAEWSGNGGRNRAAS